MTPWQDFYASVKDSSWPDCPEESSFHCLPENIKTEITELHGYTPNEYAKQPARLHQRFPIHSDTACQLKWNWSTVFLTTGKTASCHRTSQHQFDYNVFDFHNTPQKLQDRDRMRQGLWPEKGCGYCRDIEQSGGQSDRMTNLDMPGIHAPPELDQDPYANKITPRILEVYFDNLCNLKCVYCGPHFSSLWDAENKHHGFFEKNGLTIPDTFHKDARADHNKDKLFDWMKSHLHDLTNFNMLGGEPLFQTDLDRCLDFFTQNPAPNLEFQIFSNLNATHDRVDAVIAKIKNLVDNGHIRQFTLTASLDCWGAEAQYARFPLDLQIWQRNFQILLAAPWIRLIVGSTLTPLTVKTLPDLVRQINSWRQTREIHHYFNSVNNPSYLHIDILGDVFSQDFQTALDLMPVQSSDQRHTKKYLEGIALQSASGDVDVMQVLKLRTFLDELDRRRGTNWRNCYPWLDPIFIHVLH